MSRYRWAAALIVVVLAAAAPRAGAQSTTAFTGDLGYVSASGNTKLTTLSVGENIVHTNGRWTVTQMAAYVYGKTNGTESANQVRVGGRADFAFQPRLGVFGGVSYERNKFAGFDSRTDENAGLRWKAIVAPADSMSVDAGGGLTQQSNVDGTTQSDPSARVAADYKHAFSAAAYFRQLAEYVPNVKTSGSYRVNTESALVAPISAHVSIKMSYSMRYNSTPPATFGKTDRVLTTGIQLAF